jgi:hypothetical protein
MNFASRYDRHRVPSLILKVIGAALNSTLHDDSLAQQRSAQGRQA